MVFVVVVSRSDALKRGRYALHRQTEFVGDLVLCFDACDRYEGARYSYPGPHRYIDLEFPFVT